MIYTIMKGRHYSASWLGLLWRAAVGWHIGNTLEFTFRLSNECLHPSPEPLDLNKLVGLSFGLNHHRDSVRFGWRPSGFRIELYTYVYQNGVRQKEQLLATVRRGITYRGNLKIVGNMALLSVSHFSGETIGCSSAWFPQRLPAVQRLLYPYYGGNHPAPCDIEIELERM